MMKQGYLMDTNVAIGLIDSEIPREHRVKGRRVQTPEALIVAMA